MKLLILLISLISGSYFYSGYQTPQQQVDKEYSSRNSTINYSYDQCHAIAKSTGRRCKHGVSDPEDYYCWQHD